MGMGGGLGPRPAASQPADDKLSKVRDPMLNAVKWVKTRSPKEKMAMGVVAGLVVSGRGRPGAAPGRANRLGPALAACTGPAARLQLDRKAGIGLSNP